MARGLEMSVAELRQRHVAATETVNSLREQLRQRRQLLLDTDGEFLASLAVFFFPLFLGFCWIFCEIC